MYIIKEMPINERPRERFMHYGREALSNKELLAIILRTGTQSMNVLDMSTEILKQFDSIRAINACSVGDLTTIKGLGPAKAIQVLSALELGRRLYEERFNVLDPMNSPQAVYEYMRSKVEMEDQENFYVLYLDTKAKLIKAIKLFVGTLSSAIVHPREIFKHAVKLSAASLIIVHNHPSGDPTPSPSDLEITKMIDKNGKFMDIGLMDHIIIGKGKYYSFKEHGKM